MNSACFYAATRCRVPRLLAAAFFTIAALSIPCAAENADEAALIENYRLARLAMGDGRLDEARDLLTGLAVPSFLLGDWAMMDLAKISMEKKTPSKALPPLDSLVKNFPYSPLLAKTNERRVLAACAEVSSDECGRYLDRISPRDVPADFRSRRIFIEARRMEARGDKAAAYRLYQLAYYEYPDPAVDMNIERETSRLRREENAPPGKSAYPYATFSQRMGRAERLIKGLRYSEAAVDLDRILNIGYSDERKAETLYKLGHVKIRERDREGARTVFEKFMKRYPDHPQAPMASYRIAVMDWNMDKNARSAARLEGLVKSGAGKDVRARALTVLGRIAESDGRHGEAKERYRAALALAQDAEAKSELVWRLGWMDYQKGDFAAAAGVFEDFAARAKGDGDGKFYYWAARARARAGDVESAEKNITELKKYFPHTYYGLLVTQDGSAGPRPASVSRPDPRREFDWEKPDTLSLGAEAKRHYERYSALAGIGLSDEAGMELDALSDHLPKTAQAMLWIGSLYRRAGAPGKAIRLQAGAGRPDGDLGDPLWRAYYPVDYWESVAAESRARELDPFLALAIIRQESSFEPAALSPANARGLMQLIPATGESVYNKIGMAARTGKPFYGGLLFDPEVNIPLGVAHFAELLSRYDENLTLALAAYNAGKRAADRWREKYESLPDDELVEMIPYAETRGYVKRVKRNIALYRVIYSGGEKNEECMEC